MTMQALPKAPEVWRPSPGFFGACLREQSEAKVLRTFNDGADGYWAEFWQKCDSLMLLEYPTPPPEQRILRYNAKPVQELPPPPPVEGVDDKGKPVLVQLPAPPPTGSWVGQKIDFPQDFHQDMQDWIKLEPVSLRRDQVLREIAGIEMMLAAQMAMSAPPALPQPEATSGVADELPNPAWGA